jgi:hypothetical protein
MAYSFNKCKEVREIARGGQGSIFSTTCPRRVTKYFNFTKFPGLSHMPVGGKNAVLRSFNTEVKVGKSLGVINNSRINGNLGKYLMRSFNAYKQNNVTKQPNNSITVSTLHDFLLKFGLPPDGHPIYKKLITSIKKLYRAGYFHGDMHPQNIMVAYKTPYDIKYVELFDFGMAYKIKNRTKITNNISLNNAWNLQKKQNGVPYRWYNKNMLMFAPANNPLWYRKMNRNALNRQNPTRGFLNALLRTNNPSKSQ